MAENNIENITENKEQNKASGKIKVGNVDYGVSELLSKARDYKQLFLQFAKDQGKFNKEQLSRLSEIIDLMANKMETTNDLSFDTMLSTLTDLSNTFGNGKDVVNVQTRKGNIFRKSKYEEQDLQTWAKYFYATILKNQQPYESNFPAYDKSKYGFGTYWSQRGLNAADVLDLDKPGATERLNVSRKANLINNIAEWFKWVKDNNVNLKNNDNSVDDDMFDKILAFLNDPYSYNDSDLKALLRFIGGEDFVDAYFSNRVDPTKTNEQLIEEEQEKTRLRLEEKKKQEESEQNARFDKYESDAFNELATLNFNIGRLDLLLNPTDGGTLFSSGLDFMDTYLSIPYDDPRKLSYYYLLQQYGDKWNNAFDEVVIKLMNTDLTNADGDPIDVIDKNSGVVIQRAFIEHPELFINIGGSEYLIKNTIDKNGAALIFNPITGNIRKGFIGNINGVVNPSEDTPEEFAYLRNELARIIDTYVRKKYHDYDIGRLPFVGTNNTSTNYVVPRSKNGGVIKMKTGGTSLLFSDYDPNISFAQRGQPKGRTAELQKAGERPINSDNASDAHKDAGFTAVDISRLISSGADIASMVAAFVPGYGTVASGALGVGSTLLTFGTDWADDSVTAGDMWKNLALGLGMDAIGLIPGGGATTKVAKIAKNLARVIPKIITFVAASDLFANSGEIVKSWKKLGNEEHLTQDDWNNIMHSTQTILGLGTAGIRGYRNKHQTKAAIQTDKVGLEVVHNGKHKKVVFEGKEADKVKKQVDTINSNKSKEDVTKALRRLDTILERNGFKGAKVETSTGIGSTLRHPIRSWKEGMQPGKIKLKDVIDLNYNNYTGGKSARWFANLGQRLVEAKLTPDRQARLDRMKNYHQARLDALINGETAAKQRRADYDASANIRSRLEQGINTREQAVQAAPGQITAKTLQQGTVALQIADVQANRQIVNGQDSKLIKASKENKQIKQSPRYKIIKQKVDSGKQLSRNERKDWDNFNKKIQDNESLINSSNGAALANLKNQNANLLTEIDRLNNLISRSGSQISQARATLSSMNAHSSEFNNAVMAGWKEDDLIAKGWWKRGGKINKLSFIENLNHFKS